MRRNESAAVWGQQHSLAVFALQQLLHARTLRSFQQIWFWFFFTRTYVSTHLQLTSSKCANRPRGCGTCSSMCQGVECMHTGEEAPHHDCSSA